MQSSLNSQAIENTQIAPAVLWHEPCSYDEGKLWFVVLPAAKKLKEIGADAEQKMCCSGKPTSSCHV
jgi:hypothetical protein